MPNIPKSNLEIMDIYHHFGASNPADIAETVASVLGDKSPDLKTLIILGAFAQVENGADYDLECLQRDLVKAGCEKLYSRSLTEFLLMFSFTRKGEKPAYSWKTYQDMLYRFGKTREFQHLISSIKDADCKISTSIEDIQKFVSIYPPVSDSSSKTVMLSSMLASINYNQPLEDIEVDFLVIMIENRTLFTESRQRAQWNFLRSMLKFLQAYYDRYSGQKEFLSLLFKNVHDANCFEELKISPALLARDLQSFYDTTVEPGERQSPFFRGKNDTDRSRSNEGILRKYISGTADFNRKFMIEWIIFINYMLITINRIDECYSLNQLNEILTSCGWGPIVYTENSLDFDSFVHSMFFVQYSENTEYVFDSDEFFLNIEYEIGDLIMRFKLDRQLDTLPDTEEEMNDLLYQVDSMFEGFYGKNATITRSMSLKERFMINGKYFGAPLSAKPQVLN